MTDYLTNFVKTGNPNATGLLPEWKPITTNQGKVLRLGEDDTRMGNASMLKLSYTMLTNKAVGE